MAITKRISLSHLPSAFLPAGASGHLSDLKLSQRRPTSTPSCGQEPNQLLSQVHPQPTAGLSSGVCHNAATTHNTATMQPQCSHNAKCSHNAAMQPCCHNAAMLPMPDTCTRQHACLCCAVTRTGISFSVWHATESGQEEVKQTNTAGSHASSEQHVPACYDM